MPASLSARSARRERPAPSLFRELRPFLGGFGRPVALELVAVLCESVLFVAPPLLLRQLVDNAVEPHRRGELLLLVAVLSATLVLESAASAAQLMLATRMGETLALRLRSALYARYQAQPLAFFGGSRMGNLVSVVNNEPALAHHLTLTLPRMLGDVLKVGLAAAVLFSLDWRLALVSLALAPIALAPSLRGAALEGMTGEQLQATGTMVTTLAQKLDVGGALLVKVFGREASEQEQFGVTADEIRRLGVRQMDLTARMSVLSSSATALASGIVVAVGGLLVQRDSMSVGTLVAFATFLLSLYSPVAAIAAARTRLLSARVALRRVFAVLRLPDASPTWESGTSVERLDGAVELEDVWFRYPQPIDIAQPDGEDRQSTPATIPWALRGLTLRIEPGSRVAVVGPSGAGKSTLAFLLLRIHEADRGRISLDGHDIRDLSRTTIVANVGIVTQETCLFHDSVAANLRYGAPNATDEELLAACEAARLREVVEALPDGLESVVGERGYRLSGGERQRLSIARLLLHDPQIIILDEATAHLDARSESLVQEAFEQLLRGRTAIVIAHRLSTVVDADSIVVLEAGRIVGSGTHAELLAAGGLYAELCRTQLSELAA